jgi:hypothetical protein
VNRRPTSLALAVSVAVGLILGLIYAWLVEPVELYNTNPRLLRSDYRHEWVRLTALGYVADRDVERALARLEGLSGDDVQAALAALLETYAAQGQPAETMRALSTLADRLGVQTTAMTVYLGTPSSSPTPQPSPTSSPMRAATPSPSPTALLSTPTPTYTPFVSPLVVPSPHRVVSRTLICDGTTPRLEVFAQAAPEDGEERDEGAEGPPLSGVVLWLTWPGGADRAVTGLRPEVDPGYADFTLQPGIPYALSVREPAAPILSDLVTQSCPGKEGQEVRPGSWRVILEVGPR